MTRSWVAYICVYALAGSLVNYEFMKNARLNHLKPAVMGMAKHSSQPEVIDKQQFTAEIRYYEKMHEYYPHLPEPMVILGYYLYYNGERARALSCYKQAVRTAPYFFIAKFNLGVLYFQDGLYEEAAQFFQDALEIHPGLSLEVLKASAVYQQFLKAAQISNHSIIKSSRRIRADCFQLLILCLYHLEQYQEMRNAASYALSDIKDGKDFFCYYAGLGEYELKRPDQAVPFFQMAFSINAQRISALSYLALCYKDLGLEEKKTEVLKVLETLRNQRAHDPTLNEGRDISIRAF